MGDLTKEERAQLAGRADTLSLRAMSEILGLETKLATAEQSNAALRSAANHVVFTVDEDGTIYSSGPAIDALRAALSAPPVGSYVPRAEVDITFERLEAEIADLHDQLSAAEARERAAVAEAAGLRDYVRFALTAPNWSAVKGALEAALATPGPGKEMLERLAAAERVESHREYVELRDHARTVIGERDALRAERDSWMQWQPKAVALTAAIEKAHAAGQVEWTTDRAGKKPWEVLGDVLAVLEAAVPALAKEAPDAG